ncbi:hypothetical protein PIB30_040332 [Stylosanthes scabra]|uniref:Uncharacterized protein n=1 Tax=Stylosanthes scabra TaxID=79078 RepID=A0ABU6TGL7_9FABA|nr:hypothetical protein [Stylosanthes scabra]
MVKGPGFYADIGKKARGYGFLFSFSSHFYHANFFPLIVCIYRNSDLLYKDYQNDRKFTITTYTTTGVEITSTGLKKGNVYLADVATKLKSKNITTDIKVDSNSNLFTTVTVDEPSPGLKTIFSFNFPDQKSGKVELQYQHENAGISTSLGLTAKPIVNLSGVVGNNLVTLGTDVSFDTASGNLTKYNAGLSLIHSDLIASLNL